LTCQIHHVPGRLRVRVPAIKKNTNNAALLKGLLQAAPGVSAAEPNLTTGSIVVRYDPQSTSAALILALLTDRGYFQLTPAPATPVVSAVSVRIRNKVAKAVFWYCLEKAVERSVPLMLAAVL
jgi:Heavy metal associated domain 2